jgi:hypothetical protein
MVDEEFLNIFRRHIQIIRKQNPGVSSVYVPFIRQEDYPVWQEKVFASWSSWDIQWNSLIGFQLAAREIGMLMVYYPTTPGYVEDWMKRNQVDDFHSNLGIIHTRVFEELSLPYRSIGLNLMRQVMQFEGPSFLSFESELGITNLDFPNGPTENQRVWIVEMTVAALMFEKSDVVVGNTPPDGRIVYYGYNFERGRATPVSSEEMRARLANHPVYLEKPNLFAFGEMLLE